MLRIRDLHVAYGQIKALKGVDIEVYENELVALIGANGAGKSTLLQSILGIQKPHRGQITFLSQEISNQSASKTISAGVSLVKEGRGILAPMTVKENLELGAYPRHDNKRDIQQDMERILEFFPILRHRRNQLAGTLSGGEQQMLAIGRSLMAKPMIMMLDEPSWGLAPMIVNEVFHIICELKANGTTILLAEQNAKKSLENADRGYVLETGLIALHANASALLKDERVKKAYLGR
jgi:branched-chain amino acid transport system ATP-binding protein